jgi:O-antigen ligase
LNSDQQQFLETWANRLLYVAVLLLLFSTYNNRTIALKYCAYGISLVSMLVLIWQDPINVRNRLGKPTFLLLMLFLIANAVAFLQIDHAHRFACAEEYRKGLFQAGLLAVAVAIATTNLRRLRYAIITLGLASLYITLLCLWEIRGSTIENVLLNAPTSVRDFSVRFLFFFPFLIVLLVQSKSWLRVIWGCLVVLQLGLITFSGFRGGWLGLIVMIVLWIYFSRTRRKAIAFGSICILATILGWGATSSGYVAGKLRQTDTSLRWDGTWRASIDMIKNKPLAGHGFCDVAFRAENMRLADLHPEWALGKSLTDPHSVYLESAFAAGLPGILILLFLFWSTFRGVGHIVVHTNNSLLRDYSVAVLCMFTSYFVVLGIFEPLQWEQLGIGVGLALSLSNISSSVDGKPKSEIGAN